MADYYAHSFGDDQSRWELLEAHLREVAELAATFASSFGAKEWGHLAGLWHDLGKDQNKFQRRLLGERIQAPHAGVGVAYACRLDPGDGCICHRWSFSQNITVTGITEKDRPQFGPGPRHFSRIAAP